MAEAEYTDGYWLSADGLKLHYRDYAGGADGRPPILCLPGLTRNARDFEPFANRFAGEWRIIVCEMRGRGDSDYSRDPSSYNPGQYLADILALLDQTALARVVAVGTSLGGILTMLLALHNPAFLAAAVLNDIGPDIEPAGLQRIREYVGQGGSFPTWMHAARALAETNAAMHPDFGIADWLVLAKRLMCVSGNGRIVFDYDMKIAEPFSKPEGAAAFDMWPAFRALTGRPVLALRGDLSDIISAPTLARMAQEMPDLATLTLQQVGHAPTLAEPDALAAIARLLEKVA